MNIKLFRYLRSALIFSFMISIFLLAVEVYYIVTNSNRPDFWPEDTNAPYQDMTSGLFSGYVHEDNPDHEKMKAKGGVLCDFDLDGDLDLYYGYLNSYYFENKGDVFKDKTIQYGIDNSGLRGVVIGDMDNNGYTDIVKWRFMSEAQPDYDCSDYDYETICTDNTNCYWEDNNCWNGADFGTMPHNILMNNGNNIFITNTFLPPTELRFLHSLGIIDADLDGDLDLLAIQEEDDNQFILYLNNGYNNGELEFNETFSYYRDYGDISSSRVIAISDYDNDGDQDVYVARKYGKNWFFENQTLVKTSSEVIYNSNPDPFFIERAVELGIADQDVNEVGSMGYGASWGDYDNDQDFDLYLTNWGVNRLFKNNNQSFINIANEELLESDELSNGASWGDYNNDGLLDLWASSIRKPDDVFINMGDGSWDTTSSPNFLSGTQDVISGDINNDGWLDVFAAGLKMQNGPPGAKYTSLLYKNVTVDSSLSNNHWIKLKLEGRKYTISNGSEWSELSNISAIGARVVLHLPDKNIMREVIAGSGHGNMEPLQLHFGLNTNLTANGMTIYWPSRDPETNQRKISYIDGPISADMSYTYVEDIGFVGKKGDINDDNIVNVQDVVVLVNYTLNGIYPELDLLWSGDMNYDNILDVLDVIRTINNILN